MKKKILTLLFICFSYFTKAQNFNSVGIYTSTESTTPVLFDFSTISEWMQPLPTDGLTSNITEKNNLAFSDCILQNRTPPSGTTIQTLRTNGTPTMIYLPKVNNAGKITIEGFSASSVGFKIDKWNGSNWEYIYSTFFPGSTVASIDINISINEPVQLRFSQPTSGAFLSIKKITISPYSTDQTVISGQTFSSPLILRSLNNVVLENCIFKDIIAPTALGLDNCTNVIIRNCIVDNITSPSGGGHAVRINNFSDVLVDNLTIKNHHSSSGHPIALSIEGVSSKNIIVQNCKIFNVDGNGISTGGTSIVDVEPGKSTHDMPIPGVKIINNLIYNTGLSPDDTPIQNSPKHGMYIKAWDALVEGNTVYNCYDGQCISIRSTGIVRGNTCFNARTGPFSYWAQKPAGPSGKLIVENNVFYQTKNIKSSKDTRPLSTDIRILGINSFDPSSGLKFDNFIVRFNTCVMYNTVTTTATVPVVLAGFNYNNINLYSNLIVDLRTATNTPKYISNYFGSNQATLLAKNTSNFTANNLNCFVDGINFDFHLSNSTNTINYSNTEMEFPNNDIEGKARQQGSLDAGAYSAIHVQALGISHYKYNLKVGSLKQLIPTILPSNANIKTLNWTSIDNNIATVSTTGLVNAIGIGTTEIKVTSLDGNKIATCTVTVLPDNTTICNCEN
jgi:uncharacterized protein YjdB